MDGVGWVEAALIVHAVGAVIGLVATDAGWPTRIALSVLWPIGPLAFVIVVAILVAVALVAFPTFGLIVAGASLLAMLLS